MEALVATHDADVARLRALHDEYVWALNAAVADGRDDDLDDLSDEYLDAALRVLVDELTVVPCDPRCPTCAAAVVPIVRPRPGRLPGRPHRWWARRRWR